jgi:hypothetical protein
MMLAWCIQNNRVDRATGPIAAAVRESGRLLLDFSFDPRWPIAQQLPNTDAKRFFYGSSELIKQLHADRALRAEIYFDPATLDHGVWLAQRGAQMLNADGEELTLASLAGHIEDGGCFIRPVKDIKAFSGAVVTSDSFAAWRASQQARNSSLHDEMKVWVAPLKAIDAEYRLVVLDGQIRAGTRYRLGNETSSSPDVPEPVRVAASKLATGWQSARLNTMDVAQLADGTFRIVEFNCIHTSGLYAVHRPAFMAAVEEAYA